MNTTHPTDTATGTPSTPSTANGTTPDTVTYTQNELESLLQAERTKMATMFTGRVLDHLQTVSKLFLSTEVGAVPSVDLVDIGNVLELVVMGAHMETLRIATQTSVRYDDVTTPYSYALDDTMSNWTRLQRQMGKGC